MTTNRALPDIGPLADVTVRPDGELWELIFVRALRHPPERVWTALTDPVEQRKWAPFVSDRDLGVLGDVTLTMIDGENREDLPGTVLRAEPPHLLEHTWDTDRLLWKLKSAGPGTRLTLSHSVTERGWAPKVAAGWHLCLVVAENLLDGHPTGPITGDDARDHGWTELRHEYGRVLGIPAGDD
jgi:uncharacterized protein YndB with AHSA1/START domain